MSREMRIRLILLFVLLFAFAEGAALARDFSATIAKTGEVISGDAHARAVRLATGRYEVTFENAIRDCQVSGKIGRESPQNAPSEEVRIVARLADSGRNGVRVETVGGNGELKDFLFRVTVRCPEPPVPPPSLVGYVDLHTHPLANVGFGGKLLYGGVDVGALLPADPDCNANVRATSMQQALGHDGSTHGLWLPFLNPCGDSVRAGVIVAVQLANDAASATPDARGAPDFPEWPVWNDITHQKMWVDWIKRAVDSGLRVMVALAVNNKTLADATASGCDYPTDDRTSADLQLEEIKAFVGRHADFMEVALTADDLARIVRSNKLAVVLGVEIDNIGNFKPMPQPPTNAQISSEIEKLYGEGVRYIFPIHVLDNAFGATAAYQDLFNFSTFREDGHYWVLQCTSPPQPPDNAWEAMNYHFTMNSWLDVAALKAAGKVRLNTTFPSPPAYPVCETTLTTAQPNFTMTVASGGSTTTFDHMQFVVITGDPPLDTNASATAMVQLHDGTSLPAITLKPAGQPGWDKFTANTVAVPLASPISPSAIAQVVISLGSGGSSTVWSLEEVAVTMMQDMVGEAQVVRSAFGQQNNAGLSDKGIFAVKEMMRHGMLIDIDHMSDLSKKMALDTALGIGSGYPLNSGHSGLRGFFSKGQPRGNGDVSDRSTSIDQYQKIAKLHGMAGIGTGDSNAYQWAENYEHVVQVMGGAAAGFGTDTDGFAPGMPPRCDPPITAKSTHCGTQVSTVHYPFKLTVGSTDMTFQQSGLGTKMWDYNSEGVAHYGMLADFLEDVSTYPGDKSTASMKGSDLINSFMQGADYFYQTWKICEAQKANVP
jgi:microsomal dipeptidase-like Zn-dependent dipeptidase